MQAIKTKRLEFSYDKDKIIKCVNFHIEEGTINTLVGNTGGGKTTFVKLICGLLNGTGEIELFDEPITNIVSLTEKYIRVVFSDSYQNFSTTKVKNELTFPLKKLKLKKKEKDEYLNDIITLFGIEDLLLLNPNELTAEQASIIALSVALVTKPKLLILDDALTKVGSIQKKKIFKILKQLNRKNNLTILNVTHDINEILYGSYAILFYDGRIVLRGEINDFIKNEKILKKYHYELPFMAELSDRLKYYNVIDHTILDMNRMVNEIWK